MGRGTPLPVLMGGSGREREGAKADDRGRDSTQAGCGAVLRGAPDWSVRKVLRLRYRAHPPRPPIRGSAEYRSAPGLGSATDGDLTRGTSGTPPARARP